MSVTLIIPPDCLVNAFIAHVISKGKKVRLTVPRLTDRGRRARTGSYCCSSSKVEEEEWVHHNKVYYFSLKRGYQRESLKDFDLKRKTFLSFLEFSLMRRLSKCHLILLG